MSKGEKANLEIEPEWAYGKKGQPDAKYPAYIYYYVDCKKHFSYTTVEVKRTRVFSNSFTVLQKSPLLSIILIVSKLKDPSVGWSFIDSLIVKELERLLVDGEVRQNKAKFRW